MPRLLHVVTHPEVQVEPDVPVPQWGLSADGRRRAEALLTLPWVPGVGHVFSSPELKALQLAELLAAAVDRPVVVDDDLRENDRSSTGFLPPPEFEARADEFFRAPALSVQGWETAQAAQRRVVAAVRRCLAQAPDGDVAVVAHGAVGTLLWCHLAEQPIDRRHDQPGQGSWYAVDTTTGRPLAPWRRIPVPPRRGVEQGQLRSPARGAATS